MKLSGGICAYVFLVSINGGHDGMDAVRLDACGICFANFFDKTSSKPQHGPQTRWAKLSGY